MSPIETTTSPATDPNTLRGVLANIRGKISDLRAARAEGSAPTKASMTLRELRDDEEAIGDRLALAERRAAEQARADAVAEAMAAWEARRAHVAAIIDEAEKIDTEFVAAAEKLTAALERLVANARAIGAGEPISARFQEGRVVRALVRLAAGWPVRVPMPLDALRPIPFEAAEARAAWPAMERVALAELLPIPPAPSGAA